jgi:PAS domain-containing protein
MAARKPGKIDGYLGIGTVFTVRNRNCHLPGLPGPNPQQLRGLAMFAKGSDSFILEDAGNADGIFEGRRQEVLLKTGALQNAIFNSANFSSIATDAKGVIQIFNVGAERMLGYTAADVMNKITPANISDPQELVARAKALSVEFATPITPGFEALVFKASRQVRRCSSTQSLDAAPTGSLQADPVG